MNTNATAKQSSEKPYFIASVFGDEFPGSLLIWTLPNKVSYFASDPIQAEKIVSGIVGNYDVYFGLGLRREALAADKRGETKDVIGIPGFWMDIDVQGPNHKQDSLPETIDQAIELAYSFPLQQSMIVFSGGGIQAYWLFRELWIFDNDDERKQAQRLSRRFQAYLIALGKERGWKIDNTSDLARILRVPETYNRKNNPVLIEVIEYDAARRYSPSDFEDYIPEEIAENKPKLDPENILSGADDGSRNNSLFAYACSLQSRKITKPEAKILILQAAEKCRPTVSDEYALKMLERVYERYEKPWLDIVPLPDLLPIAPEMPAGIVPAPFRGFTSDIADRMQVALEIPAVSIIVALSSVVGRSIGIFPKQNDSWIVIPNLWGLVAARSGMLKSPAIEEGTKPLGHLEHAARIQYDADQSGRSIDSEIEAARLKAIKQKLEKAAMGNDEETISKLKAQLLELQKKIEAQESNLRRYRVNDATTEKLLEILVENPKCLLVYRDELSGWLRSLDKVGREMDRAFYLESWNGNQSFTTDRIGRGTVYVPALCLSVFGGIQPPKLAQYVSDALDGTSNDDGLIQRFQLAVHPEQPKDWKLIDRAPDKAAKDRAVRVFKILDSFEPVALGVPIVFDIPALHFDPEAQELFNEWIMSHQRRLLQGEGTQAFESHLAKYRSLMPSLALLFHLVDWADSHSGNISPVSLEAAKLAAVWCDYMELHARKIYAGSLNPDLQAAHLILQKIKQGKIKDGTSIRDIYRNQWTGLQTKERVHQGLILLADNNYLRLDTLKAVTGRPSSEVITINPKLDGDSDDV